MKLKYLFLALLAGAALSACNGKEEKEDNQPMALDIVSPADNALSFAAAGESKTITFKSTRDWTASKTESWITLSKISGSASGKDQSITVTATANDGFERSGSVKITSMAGTKTISVTQAGGKTITYTSIADLRAMAGDLNTLATTGKVIEGEVFIKGIVVSDPRIQSLNSNKTVYVMDETAGIQVFCANNAYNYKDEDNSLLFGHEVQLEVSGALLYPYGKALELVSGLDASNKTVGFDNAKIKVLSKDNDVTPKSVTMADFMDNKYEGSYVKITDKKVQVEESSLEKTWWVETKNSQGKVNSVYGTNLQTEDNETIVARVAQYASYKDEKVPQGSGYLQGIAGYYNGTMQVMFSDTLSFRSWTGERFAIQYGAKTISDIYANPSGNVAVDAVVVAAGTQTLLLGDATGILYCHVGANHSWKVGDKVHVEGGVTTYGTTELIQISTPDKIEASTADVSAPALGSPKVLTAALLEAYDSNKTEYVQLEGKCVVSGNYVNLTIENTAIQGSLVASELTSSVKDGDLVVIKGFFGGCTKSKAGVTYFNILPAEIGQSSTPNFDVTEAEKGISVGAKATSATINVRGNVAWTATSDNTAFVVTPASGEGAAQITVEFGENSSTTDARVANITVSTTANVTVKSFTVKVTQAAASATGAKWNRVTSAADILAGGTFIIGYEETASSGVIVPMRADDCGAKTTANGIIITGTNSNSNTSDKGTIDMATYSGTGTYEITITASTLSGAVNLQLIDGSYIGCPGAKNTARLYTAASEANTAYTVTAKDNDTFQLTCEAQKSTTYYFLQYNSSSPRFCNYTGSQKNPVFYKYE